MRSHGFADQLAQGAAGVAWVAEPLRKGSLRHEDQVSFPSFVFLWNAFSIIRTGQHEIDRLD
jgi:hypothetical protein